MLRQCIIEHFVAPDEKQTVRLFVAVCDGQVVGHCLVSLDTWCGRIYATIVGYELDVPVPRDQLLDAFEEIKGWAKERGASTLRVLVSRLGERGVARVRLFRGYGFVAHKIIMDQAIR